MTPQLSKNVTFGPYEDVLEDWQLRPSNIQGMPQYTLGVIFVMMAAMVLEFSESTHLVPWFKLLLHPDPTTLS